MTPDLGKKERRFFDPDSPVHRWKLWAVYKGGSGRGLIRHFYLKRIAVVAAALALFGWLGAVTAVWCWMKYDRGYEDVRFTTVLRLPWSWHEYHTGLARHYFMTGTDQLAHSRNVAALVNLRAAVNLEPANLQYREGLGEAAFRFGLRRLALQTLVAGATAAAQAGDAHYLSVLFSVAFSQQADDLAAKIGRALLPATPDGTPIHRFIVLETAQALCNRGHFAEAEQLANAWKLSTDPDGCALLANCLWGQGHRQDAVNLLERALGRFSRRADLYAILELFARDAGQGEAARRYAVLREMADPGHPQPRLDFMYTSAKLGGGPALEKEIATYLSDFKSDPNALFLLMEFAVKQKRPDVAERVRTAIQALHLSAAGADLGIAEAAIAKRDFPQANKALDDIQSLAKLQRPDLLAMLAGFRAVVQFGEQSDTAEAAFTDFLTSASKIPPAEGSFLAQALLSLKHPREAMQFLQILIGAQGRDEPEILTELVQAEAATHDQAGLRRHLPDLLLTRSPDAAALKAAAAVLTSPQDRTLAARARAAAALTAAMP